MTLNVTEIYSQHISSLIKIYMHIYEDYLLLSINKLYICIVI